MDEIQAAVLRIKLRYLDDWLAERRSIAAQYIDELGEAVIPVARGAADLHHLFVVRAPRRDELMNYLKVNNIETKIHWAQPLHRMQATWANTCSSFPCTDSWSSSILSLPCYPGLTTEEITRICDSVHEFFKTTPLR